MGKFTQLDKKLKKHQDILKALALETKEIRQELNHLRFIVKYYHKSKIPKPKKPEIEIYIDLTNRQVKKDTDEAQDVSVSGDTKNALGKKLNAEHMPTNSDNQPGTF